MNGIDKITERITMDAQADANAILARAKEDASAVLANYQKMAEDEKNRLLEEGRKKTAEREIRMVSVAELEEMCIRDRYTAVPFIFLGDTRNFNSCGTPYTRFWAFGLFLCRLLLWHTLALPWRSCFP